MMRGYETHVGLLALFQVLLEPGRLFMPESLFGGLTHSGVPDVAIQDDEVTRAPIERIIGLAHIEKLIELAIVSFVVSERREERRLVQEIVLDIEEDRPLRGIG